MNGVQKKMTALKKPSPIDAAAIPRAMYESFGLGLPPGVGVEVVVGAW